MKNSNRFTNWNRTACHAIAGLFSLTLVGTSWAQHSAVEPAQRGGGAHQRHLALMERVQDNQGPLDILFVGDSITQAWENAGKSVWEKYYTDRGLKAVNIGISGDRTQHVLWRLDQGAARGLEPKVTVVMIGTNNSANDRNTASEMVDGVRAVVKRLHEELPKTKILLLGIFPRGEDFNEIRGKILQVNQTFRKLEEEMEGTVFYLDIGHHFLETDGTLSTEIMPDFLHLTQRGYEIWAESIDPMVQKLMQGGQEEEAAEEDHSEVKEVAVQEAPEKDPSDPAGDWRWFIRGPEDQLVEFLMHLETSGQPGAVTGYFLLDRPEGQQRLEIQEGSWEGVEIVMSVSRKRQDGEVMNYKLSGKTNEVNDAMEGIAKAMFNGAEVEIPWNASRKQ